MPKPFSGKLWFQARASLPKYSTGDRSCRSWKSGTTMAVPRGDERLCFANSLAQDGMENSKTFCQQADYPRKTASMV
jgi:hypothetical protein